MKRFVFSIIALLIALASPAIAQTTRPTFWGESVQVGRFGPTTHPTTVPHIASNGDITPEGVNARLKELETYPHSIVLLDFEDGGGDRRGRNFAEATAWINQRVAICRQYRQAGHRVGVFGGLPTRGDNGLIAPLLSSVRFASDRLLDECDFVPVPVYLVPGEWDEKGNISAGAMTRIIEDLTIATCFARGRPVVAVYAAYTNGAPVAVPNAATFNLAFGLIRRGYDGMLWGDRDDAQTWSTLETLQTMYGRQWGLDPAAARGLKQ